MKKIFVLLFILASFFSFSQQSGLSVANAILESRNEVYIKFRALPNEVQSFSHIMSVDSYDGKTVYAYANKREFDKFLQTNRDFELVDEYYNSSKAITMATTLAEMENWDRYPTYEVYVEMMQYFAAQYSDICKLDTIGYSSDGRLLLALKISDNVDESEAEPEFLYTGMMHGDELIGGMVLLRLVDHILKNYGTDAQITKLVNNVQIFINPFANPDGTYFGGNNTVADSRRTNGQNIDLNRNYLDFIAGAHPDGLEYGTETVLFMNYASEHNFVMSANTHSGAELINYPYDTNPVFPSDNDWWVMVSREYANNAQTNSPSGYLTDLDNGITNGFAWYTITGSRQDYMNYYHNCREVTMELSTSKKLDSNDLPAYWNYNKKALLDYLEQVTYGLRGIVTDSITHWPLQAKVYIDGFDAFNSHVFSFSQFGDYYRLLKAGNYSVTFSAPGYKSKTIDVQISDYAQTILDVELANIDIVAPTANFEASRLIAECNPTIEFINNSEGSASTEYLWDFGDGTGSTDFEPIHLYGQNGTYTVKLFAENEHGEDSLIKEQYISINLNSLTDIPSYVICEAAGTVNADLGLNGTFYWFNNANDQTPFNTGTTWTTPELSQNTSYFIQQLYTGVEFNGGETNNSAGGSYISDATDNYLIFNCNQECVLQTVKVYAQGDGNRTIYLKNSMGEVLHSADIFIEDGMQTIALNFSIPIGTSFRLGCAASSNLFRGSVSIFQNFPFPYNIGSVISLIRSNDVWWNDGTKYYAYFYDWNVKLPDCYSEKTPLNIYVNQDAVAAFTHITNGNIVAFTNASTGADTYLWDFGDSNTSSEIDPVHEYLQPGEYTVKLTASSNCGNDEFSSIVVVLTGIDSEFARKLSVYPNPTEGTVTISSKDEIDNIRILNISGKLIESHDLNSNSKVLDISEYKAGIYFIELIYTDKSRKITKITKL